jgi:UPF0042 nucleotide-binding protein
MKFVIVTGMSGAGKSTTLKMLEDVGYFCVDNLPFPLITKLSELTLTPSAEINKIAVGVDIRSGNTFSEFEKILDELTQTGFQFEILFLDSKDDVLIKRYKETRRNHPLAKEGRLEEGIKEERKKLEGLRGRADYILDTSNMLTRELQAELNKIFVENKEFKNIYVTVCSFGFKYGIPSDADLVFDVRFLENPFYYPELKHLTGNDEAVYNFVMSKDSTKEYIKYLINYLDYSFNMYAKEGKRHLTVAVGCTGGQHRSASLVNFLYRNYKAKYNCLKKHRDIV